MADATVSSGWIFVGAVEEVDVTVVAAVVNSVVVDARVGRPCGRRT